MMTPGPYPPAFSGQLAPEQFLAAVDLFLRRSGMSASMLGKCAVNDPGLVFQLRRGREPRRKTMQRVLDYMASYTG
ncbi:MAG: hypothetical protein GC131_02840 [Alphaproteobacteria bacterium]|nr:hypothetical protein [Alphaproteobacteria bacterium]